MFIIASILTNFKLLYFRRQRTFIIGNKKQLPVRAVVRESDLLNFLTAVRAVWPLGESYFSAVRTAVGKAPEENRENDYDKADKADMGFNGYVVIVVQQLYAHNAPINKENGKKYAQQPVGYFSHNDLLVRLSRKWEVICLPTFLIALFLRLADCRRAQDRRNTASVIRRGAAGILRNA